MSLPKPIVTATRQAGGGVALSWTLVGDAESYALYRNGSLIRQVGWAVETLLDEGAPPEATVYRVDAFFPESASDPVTVAAMPATG